MALSTPTRPRLGSPRELDPRLVVTLACVAVFALAALLLSNHGAAIFGVVPVAVLLTIIVSRDGGTVFDRAWITGRNRLATRGIEERAAFHVHPRDVPPLLPPQR